MNLNSDKAYNEHLLELGHEILSEKMIAGLDAWYAELLPTDKNANILDFACGLGDFIEYLKIKGYKNIEGVDKNPLLCENASKKTSCPVHTLTSITEFASQRKDKYDFINMKDVLEHIEPEEAIEILQMLKNTLKSDGILVASCPQACGFTTLFTLYNDYTHIKLFTERSLKQLLRSAGFENISLIYPKTKLNFRPSSLLLKLAQAIWFRILMIIYFIERPGEEKPPYIGDRIAIKAVK